MLSSIDGLAARQLKTRPLRAALTAFGVVLGVGMVFGVLLLVGTIRHTFDDLVSSAWGKTDLLVSGEANGILPESTVARVRAVPGVSDAAPYIGGAFTRLDARGRAVKGASGQISVAGYDTAGTPPFDFRWVEGRKPGTGAEIALERNWARARGLSPGDRMRVATPSGTAELPVIGIFSFSSGLSFGGRGFAAMPVDAIRPLIDVPTGFHQVSVVVDDKGQLEAIQKRLERALGPGATVKTPQGFSEDVKQQLNGLNMILYFFSGVALFVGGFLILNSFNMTVLQRMREIGTLRTLGASRRLITRTILTEALIVGALGSVLGLGLGIGLATGLIALIRGMEMPVGTLQITPGPAIVAVVIGMLVTAGGALWPARRAGRVSPIRAVLGNRGARTAPRRSRLVLGLALTLPGALLGGQFWGADNSGSTLSGLYGISLTMTMFVGIALLAPFVIVPVIRLLAVPMRKLLPAGGRLAADSLLSNAARTAATAAALTIGLSVVVVNSTFSASFMGTVSDQLEASFARDYTVQAAGQTLETGGGPGVPHRLAREIAAMPETRAVTAIRAVFLDLPGIQSGQKQGIAKAYDPSVYALMDATPIKGATREAALRGIAAGGVIIGPQYARLAGLDVGDKVSLLGPGGARRAPVTGVLDGIADMGGNELQMSLDTMQRIYRVTNDAQVAVRARSDAAAAPLGRRIEAVVARDYPGVELASIADKKQEVRDQVSATSTCSTRSSPSR
jgi:putative ABC transport system permease protein